jgi:hypothetical protein
MPAKNFKGRAYVGNSWHSRAFRHVITAVYVNENFATACEAWWCRGDNVVERFEHIDQQPNDD